MQKPNRTLLNPTNQTILFFNQSACPIPIVDDANALDFMQQRNKVPMSQITKQGTSPKPFLPIEGHIFIPAPSAFPVSFQNSNLLQLTNRTAPEPLLRAPFLWRESRNVLLGWAPVKGLLK